MVLTLGIAFNALATALLAYIYAFGSERLWPIVQQYRMENESAPRERVTTQILELFESLGDLVVVGTALILCMSLATYVLCAASHILVQTRPQSAHAAYSKVWKNRPRPFLPSLGYLAFLMIVINGAFVAVLQIPFVVAPFIPSAYSDFFYLAYGLVPLFLVQPGLRFMLMSIPTCILERRGALYSFRRSWDLMREGGVLTPELIRRLSRAIQIRMLILGYAFIFLHRVGHTDIGVLIVWLAYCVAVPVLVVMSTICYEHQVAGDVDDSDMPAESTAAS